MDIQLKNERAIMFCHGCLSGDRNMSRINEELSELFFKLRNDQKYEKHAMELRLCWECVAFLKKLKAFQARIKTAQCLLVQYLQSYYTQDENRKPQCQSVLKSIHIDKYHYSFNEEEKVINNEVNNINDESNNDKNKQKEYYQQNKAIIDEYNAIKMECNDNIKEEYSSNDQDSEYYDTEFKLESEDAVENSSPHKQRKKSSAMSEKYYERKKYENYATITKRKDVCKIDPVEYSESVCLSQKEYENLLRKDKKSYGYSRMPFKCKDCAVGYLRKLDLLRHESFSHINKTPFPYKCAACTTIITSAEDLDQHWTKAHTVMLKCTLCSEFCRSTGEVKKHLNRRHTKTFACKECTLEFGILRDFVKHYKSAHETVICDHCNMSFTKKKSLASHIKRFHIPAYCDICKRTYSNHKTFKYHRQVTHPELIAGETRAELSYCVECDRQYPSVYKYRRHLQLSPRHTPQKKLRVPCPDCGKVFTRTNFMKNHYKFAHLKVTKNYCDECDKYYTTGYGLRKHIERVHKKIAQPKDKICDLCGRGFGTNKILINHRRTHTGERPHKCQYCPAAFAQETAMKTHQKTQHKNISIELIS